MTGADVVAALRRDGVDVARWRPRVALRLGDLDPAAAAAASEDADAASRSRGDDDAWRRRPVVPGFVGWRALGEDDVVTFDVGSVGLLVQLEDALVADTVPGASAKKRQSLARRFPRRGEADAAVVAERRTKEGRKEGEEEGTKMNRRAKAKAKAKANRRAPSASAPRTISADGAATTMTR